MQLLSPIIAGIAFAAIVVALTALARRLPMPTPILQVLAGLVVGMVPGIEIPHLEPDVVFFVFLPPILWSAAFFTSLREFKANVRPISLLAVGLVIVTTAATIRAVASMSKSIPYFCEYSAIGGSVSGFDSRKSPNSRKKCSKPPGAMISRIRQGSSPAFQNVCHWSRGLKARSPASA